MNKKTRFNWVVMLLVGLLMMSMVSAMDWDNIEQYTKEGEYGKYEIRNSILGIPFLQLDKVEDIELRENYCKNADNCFAIKDVIIYEETSLVDDVRFFDTDGRIINIESYNFYYSTESITIEKDIFDYVATGLNLNKTIKKEYIKVGTKEVEEQIWKEYTLGQELPEGEYKLKLEGEKDVTQTVDWQIKTNGIWTEEWAIWEGLDEWIFPDDGYCVNVVGTECWNNEPTDFNKSYDQDFNTQHTSNYGASPTQEFYYNFSSTVTYFSGMNFTLFMNGTHPSQIPRNLSVLIPDSCYDNGVDMKIQHDAGFAIYHASWSNRIRMSCYNYTSSAWKEIYNVNSGSWGLLPLNNFIETMLWLNTTGEITATQSYPEDYYNTIDTTLNLSANFTGVGDNNITSVKILVYDSGDALDYSNTDSSINTLSYNKTWTTNTLTDDTYKWAVFGYGSTGLNGSTTNRTFTIDTTNPNVTIEVPTDGETFNLAVLETVQNVQLNFTATDTNLQTCWFYNISASANQTLACGLNTTMNLSVGSYTILAYANDTLGNLGQDSKSITVAKDIVENSQTFNATTVETATEGFVINITYNESQWTGASTNLVYNGTKYASVQYGTGDDIRFERSFSIPSTVSASQENRTFYWEFAFTNATGVQYFNSTTQTQTVDIISLTSCDSGNIFINFTTKEFLPPTHPIRNATFEATFEVRFGNQSVEAQNFTYSDVSEENSTWSFCLEPATNNYTIDGIIEYDATGYAQNYYYLNDLEISNSTTKVNLYLLNDSAATATILRVIDAAQATVGDVYITIQSYDVGTDTYFTTGMAHSSSEGEDLAYMNWYDTFYKFILVKDGTTELITTGYKITETPQIFQLTEDSEYTFTKFNDFEYSLIYNDVTQNFVLTYIKPSGDVDAGCLRVVKRTVNNETTICSQCETSSSATIYCNVAGQGNGTFIAEFYATGSYKLIDMISELVGSVNEIYEAIPYKEATTYALLFAGIVLSMFLFSPVLAVIGMILGMFLGMLMGFTALHYSEFLGIVVVGGLIVWLLKR